jgi:diguanylate cyclase (GGDEF)-like protein/PAS domain S-box-containing protein
VSMRCLPIFDDKTKLHLVVGLAEDITDSRRSQEIIAASEARYRQLFNANPLPKWVYDLETLAFLAVNDAAVEHYGYSREEFLAMSIANIRPDDDLPALRRSIETNVPLIEHAGMWRHRKRDGTLINVEITSHRIEFEGRPAKLVLANDVTYRVEQEQKIARLNRIRAVIGGMTSAMLRLTDRDALLHEACRIATTQGVFPMAWVAAFDTRTQKFEILAAQGGDPAEIDIVKFIAELPVQRDLHDTGAAPATTRRFVANDIVREPVLAPVSAELVRRGFGSCAVFPLLVNGQLDAVLVLLASEREFFDDEEVTLLEWLSADLSFALQHIRQSRRLDYLAFYDSLTGLANERLFLDRLEQFIAGARHEQSKVCMVVIDLVHFTRINESHGRKVGDELLLEIGKRLQRCLVEPFALARIGADTFAAASPRGNGHIATQLRDAMFDAIKASFHADGAEIRISAQAGIALFPEDGGDAGAVFKSAEVALKLAKSSGDAYAYYSRDMHARIAQRLAMEEQLRAAVETQQFVLHYQARVDMKSGEVVGAEALIRWQHPDRGLVAPVEFIGFAEETNLIVPIGAWVIDQVCAQQAAWLAAGMAPVPVAVNVSSIQFENGDLVQTVRDALTLHSLEARYLQMELTESAVMVDPERAAQTLRTLRKLGVGLALDDFGTGYSSLAHLKRFPFDAVKIDRTFVVDITSNPEDAAIAGAIIAMAHRLGLEAVAEGIETQGQFNYLRGQGRDGMQGFYFSAAVTADEFESLLRGGKRVVLPVPASEDRQTLLIVDDERGVRASLNRALRRDGYTILQAGSGPEALELLALNPVQVIISDQRMPDMSGTEFLGTVKELYPDTMRIILSGYTDLSVVTDSVNRGAVFKFLTKPWDDDLLREQVRDAFRRYRQTPSVQ